MNKTMNNEPISAQFPFESRYAVVHGSKMHYIDEGEGDTILFLHGNPTSSYLWRNIIPHVTHLGRVIVPDLIGMGKSDKPAINYRFFDHYKYLVALLDQLDIGDNITLVIHDWGSGLGFHFAAENPERIKGIAFMEAMMRPLTWAHFPQSFRIMFRLMRAPAVGYLMLNVANMFLKQVVPQSIVRKLSAEEVRAYEAPFSTIASRDPVRQWPAEVPISGSPADVHQAVSSYSQWLQQSRVPKLLFYAQPGSLITADGVTWAEKNLPNLKTVDIGQGIHFVQEDNPHLIGRELAAWVPTL